MKVGINILPLKTGHRVRGIGSYTKNLLDSLKKREDLEVVEFEDVNELKGVDLVHYPFFDLFQHTLQNSGKFPTVVTIHDVVPLVFPQHYPTGIRGSVNLFLQKRALGGVKAVITDSVSSKQDIAKYLNLPLEKIYPIYLGVGRNFKVIKDKKKLEVIRGKYNLPEEFVLYIGNNNWNKNLLSLAKACLQASKNLVLVGASFLERENLGHPELRPFKNFLNEFEGNPLVKILGFVENSDLPALINLATLLALPSLYEGFGLPILEAQACGCPVITSNVSSMPEVAGKGAIYVDPYNTLELKQAIETLLRDRFRREKLIKEGFANVAKFTWEKTAEETVKIYQHILAETTKK